MSVTGSVKDVLREVDYAYNHTRFFRQHMESNGLVPGDIQCLGSFQRIPVTRKLHYRKNYPMGVLATGFSLAHRHVMRFQSSGTSGERLNSAILSYDLARRQATSISVNRDFESLWRPGGRPKICRYAPPNCSDVECGVGFTTMEERTLSDGTLVLSVAHDLLATPERMIVQSLDEIEIYDPEILVVDPSHLAFLVRQATRLNRKIKTSRKLHIISGYTQLTQVAKRQIRDFFGQDVPIGNMLGMSELGYLGFECHCGNTHINNQDFFLEFINENGEAPLGKPGELVLSTIDDRLIPRIRYATGDIYTLFESPCLCGSDLPVVTMEGRSTHWIRLPGGSLASPGQVDEIVGDCSGIDLYQLQQFKERFVFRYIKNGAFSERQKKDLINRLKQFLCTSLLQLEECSYIACERSGKFQSCISNLKGDPHV